MCVLVCVCVCVCLTYENADKDAFSITHMHTAQGNNMPCHGHLCSKHCPSYYEI